MQYIEIQNEVRLTLNFPVSQNSRTKRHIMAHDMVSPRQHSKTATEGVYSPSAAQERVHSAV